MAAAARALQQLLPCPPLLCSKVCGEEQAWCCGLPWKELPRRTEFVLECWVVVSFQEKNVHQHYKTRWPSKLTQAGHRIRVFWNYIIKGFFLFVFVPSLGRSTCILANKYWILVSHWILMTGWLEPVLQLWGKSKKEEGLVETVGSEHKSWARCCRPGPGIPETGGEETVKKFFKKIFQQISFSAKLFYGVVLLFFCISQVLLKHHCYGFFIWRSYEVALGEIQAPGRQRGWCLRWLRLRARAGNSDYAEIKTCGRRWEEATAKYFVTPRCSEGKPFHWLERNEWEI